MNKVQIESFERLLPLMTSLCTELKLLSGKRPHDPLNKFKLGVVNDQLKTANELLGDDLRPIKGFKVFSEDGVPSNSDVVIVLSQYLQALERLHDKNVVHESELGGWVWKAGNRATNISTYKPSNPGSLLSRL